MSVGSNIKRIRKLHKVQVAELAEKTGIKPESIYAWEREEYNPSEENLQKIAKSLGVPVKDFYEENPTSVQDEAAVAEKSIKAPVEIYRDLVEANSEYRLVPKVILEGKYVIVLESEIREKVEGFRAALKSKDELIADLKEEIKTYRASRTTAKERK